MLDALQNPPGIEQAQPSESEIIAAAQQDPGCFHMLYDHWVLPIYQYHYFQTGNVPDAEDLTSQVFLGSYLALPRYVYNGHFAGWLFTIARNQTREFYRKRRQEVPLDDMKYESPFIDPLETMEEREEIRRLQKTVDNKIKNQFLLWFFCA